jgi:hypothetical protein
MPRGGVDGVVAHQTPGLPPTQNGRTVYNVEQARQWLAECPEQFVDVGEAV